MKALVGALLLASAGAWGAEDARVHGPCPVAPSVPTVDLGHYRGTWQVLGLNGSPLGGWQACPTAPESGRELAWVTCSFSLCGLADGAYAVRFSVVPGAKVLELHVQHGMLWLPPTDLAVQNGNYGLDATGSAVPVMIDLAGYAGEWSISPWPGPFHGLDTGRRAEIVGGKLRFSLYPGVAYEFRFATGQVGTLTVAADAGVAASGDAFAVAGGEARFQAR